METRILIADPHTVVREGLRALVSAREDLLVVGEAADGAQALELTERLRPTLVILELSLPRLSGIEVIRRLAKSGGEARSLVLTARDGQKHVEESLRAGAAGYLLKSSPSKELFEAIGSIVAGQSYVSPAVLQHLVDSIVHDRESAQSELARLTSREQEVLQLIAEGLSSKEIAQQLCVSAKTVDTHRARLMEKLGIHKVSGLVRFAIREGLLAP